MSTSDPGRSTASTSPPPKRSPVVYGAVARAEVRTCLRPMISVKASTAPAERGLRGVGMCDSSFASGPRSTSLASGEPTRRAADQHGPGPQEREHHEGERSHLGARSGKTAALLFGLVPGDACRVGVLPGPRCGVLLGGVRRCGVPTRGVPVGRAVAGRFVVRDAVVGRGVTVARGVVLARASPVGVAVVLVLAG